MLGWINQSPEIYTRFGDSKIQSRFQSEIISKERALSIVNDFIKRYTMTLHVDRNNTSFHIETSLDYISLSKDYQKLLDVDPDTGLPTQIMPPWWTNYYENPRWWTELEKDYLGLPSNRVENGYLAWTIRYRDCSECIAQYPIFSVDAINGKVLTANPG